MSELVKRQRGLSLVGFLTILLLVTVCVLIGMRLFPMYSEYYSVIGSMKSLQEEPNISKKAPDVIKELFFRRLYVNYVDNVKRKNVLVGRNNKGVFIRVKYEVRRPMVGNLDVVASFDKTMQIGP